MGQPLYDRCKFFILDYACRKKLSSGAQLPSQRELCSLTGMSMITVRRAIAELEQEKYVRTQSGKGVFLLKDCSHPTPEKKDEIVLFDVQRISRDVGLISDSLRRLIARRGCSLRAFSCGEKVTGEYLSAAAGAIGVIFMGLLNDEWQDFLLHCGKPVVIVGGNNGPVKGIPTVFSTNTDVPEHMIQFFTEKGCKRFALLNAPESYQAANIYQTGIEQALQKRHIPLDPALMVRIPDNNRSSTVYHFLHKNQGHWDCLLVQRGILLDTLSGCMELGIDPGLIGVFDPYWFQNNTLNSKIFYFGSPSYAMELAQEVLFDQMLPAESRRFHSEWIQRESALLPAISNPTSK